jgi:hypothetical protein
MTQKNKIMNGDKKMYLYSGLAIALAVVAYLVITKKKDMPNASSEGTPVADDSGNVATTTTGEVVSEEQVVIPTALAEILNKTSAQATVDLVNKPIYTKLDDVKVRYQNFVNNGIIDNVMSTITNRGTVLGTVIQVVDDKGKLVNADGRILKWFKIKPSQIALDDMNRNKSFLTHVFLPNTTGKEIYVREDTVKLEK